MTATTATQIEKFGSYCADDLFMVCVESEPSNEALDALTALSIEAPRVEATTRPALALAVAFMDSLTACACTWVIYTCIDRPIRRLARRIAFSGHWGY